MNDEKTFFMIDAFIWRQNYMFFADPQNSETKKSQDRGLDSHYFKVCA